MLNCAMNVRRVQSIIMSLKPSLDVSIDDLENCEEGGGGEEKGDKRKRVEKQEGIKHNSYPYFFENTYMIHKVWLDIMVWRNCYLIRSLGEK